MYIAYTSADLIADISLANATPGANTITLAAATTAPYILTAVDNTTDGATGLPLIAANDNLTIAGYGDTIERSTASGTPAFRPVRRGRRGVADPGRPDAVKAAWRQVRGCRRRAGRFIARAP